METHRKEFTYWLLVDILGYLDISPIRVSGLEVSICTKTFIAGSCLLCVHAGTTPEATPGATPGTTTFFYLQAVLTQRQRPTQNYFKSKRIGKYFKLDEILKISIW